MAQSTTAKLDWIHNLKLDTSHPTAYEIDTPSQADIDPPEPGKDSLHLIHELSAIPQAGALSPAQQLDVDETSLLVDMAARREVDSIKNPIGWYMNYANKLVTLGWSTKEINGVENQETGKEFKLSEVAIKILTDLLGGPAGTAINAAITQLRQYDKDGVPGTQAFSSATKKLKKHSFNTSYAQLNSKGEPELAIAFFSVEVEREVTDILVATLKQQTTKLFAHSTTFRLTASYDDDTRKIVREAIKDVRGKYIKVWKIKK